MKLRRVPVRPVQLVLLCPKDECGGDMVFTGVIYPMHPLQYKYKCSACHGTVTYDGKYPKIEYEPLET